jgi:hypothetical protein
VFSLELIRLSPFFPNFTFLAAPQATKKANEKTAPKGGLINPFISKADMPVNNLFC